MSNSVLTVKQGDYGADATLAFTLVDPDGTITTLAGRTITLFVFTDPLNPAVSGTCTFDSGMRFHYVPLVTDFAAPGVYSYEVEIDGIATGRLSGSTGTFIIEPSPTH